MRRARRWGVVGEYLAGGRSRWDASDLLTGFLMEQAEIVFTTLSSTGRRAFLQGRKFDLVLVDEAAQASEVASLQPLALASGRCATPDSFIYVRCVDKVHCWTVEMDRQEWTDKVHCWTALSPIAVRPPESTNDHHVSCPRAGSCSWATRSSCPPQC